MFLMSLASSSAVWWSVITTDQILSDALFIKFLDISVSLPMYMAFLLTEV